MGGIETFQETDILVLIFAKSIHAPCVKARERKESENRLFMQLEGTRPTAPHLYRHHTLLHISHGFFVDA